jgi:hypothetical protein
MGIEAPRLSNWALVGDGRAADLEIVDLEPLRGYFVIALLQQIEGDNHEACSIYKVQMIDAIDAIM